jgi:glycosyltransferase involved in cell wall biosynthesis
MKLTIEKSVVVITPTVGEPELLDAVKSVADQSYRNIKHLVVVDGPDYWADINKHELNDYGVSLTLSPENTGGSGFYGHRIFAAYPHLVNSDYIAFLDADNWYESDHIASLVETLENGMLDFAYSFRKIFNKKREYRCDDNCESLGKWPVWPLLGQENNTHFPYLIDTSSFLFKREFLIQNCQLWASGWGGDRRYLSHIYKTARFLPTGKYSLCYRLDGNKGSVGEDFFEEGNKKTLSYYSKKLPWRD